MGAWKADGVRVDGLPVGGAVGLLDSFPVGLEVGVPVLRLGA